MQSHKWKATEIADEDLHRANCSQCIMTMLRQIDQNEDQFAQEILLSLSYAVLIQLGTGMPLSRSCADCWYAQTEMVR